MTWRGLLRELLPPIVLRNCRRAVQVIKRGGVTPQPDLSYYCPVCEQGVARFLPLSPRYDEEYLKHGYVHSPYLAETMNRRNYKCPNCQAKDRDRLCALFLDEQALKGQLPSVLDIAPTRALTNKILRLHPKAYRTADLHARAVDDNVDITDMSGYADHTYGAILCSHVLEHVPDDKKALSELYRILEPGGWAILMVPINLGLSEVCEDPTITDPGLRWKYFGQDDHVRLYSKAGFLQRLTCAGFTVNQYTVESFGQKVFERCGVSERSVLYVGVK